MIYCTKCGKANPEDSGFCGSCGAPIAAPAAAQQPRPGPEGRPGRNRTIAIIAGTLIVAGGAAGGVWYVMQGDDDTATDPGTTATAAPAPTDGTTTTETGATAAPTTTRPPQAGTEGYVATQHPSQHAVFLAPAGWETKTWEDGGVSYIELAASFDEDGRAVGDESYLLGIDDDYDAVTSMANTLQAGATDVCPDTEFADLDDRFPHLQGVTMLAAGCDDGLEMALVLGGFTDAEDTWFVGLAYSDGSFAHFYEALETLTRTR